MRVYAKMICLSATFFCYLGDILSAGGCCELTVTSGVKTVWKKFRELLPVITYIEKHFVIFYP